MIKPDAKNMSFGKGPWAIRVGDDMTGYSESYTWTGFDTADLAYLTAKDSVDDLFCEPYVGSPFKNTVAQEAH